MEIEAKQFPVCEALWWSQRPLTKNSMLLAEIVRPKDHFWGSCFILGIIDFYHLTESDQKQSYITKSDWIEGNGDKNEGLAVVYPPYLVFTILNCKNFWNRCCHHSLGNHKFPTCWVPSSISHAGLSPFIKRSTSHTSIPDSVAVGLFNSQRSC